MFRGSTAVGIVVALIQITVVVMQSSCRDDEQIVSALNVGESRHQRRAALTPRKRSLVCGTRGCPRLMPTCASSHRSKNDERVPITGLESR